MFSSKATTPDGNLSYVDTYVFNFCKPTTKSCDASEEVWAYKSHNNTLDNNTITCMSMSGSDLMESYDYKVILDEEQNTRHLLYSYKGGDKCPSNQSRSLGLEVEILCDAKINATRQFKNLHLEDPCVPRFIYSSPVGCPVFTASAWIIFVADHPWILAIFLIIFGFISTF